MLNVDLANHLGPGQVIEQGQNAAHLKKLKQSAPPRVLQAPVEEEDDYWSSGEEGPEDEQADPDIPSEPASHNSNASMLHSSKHLSYSRS